MPAQWQIALAVLAGFLIGTLCTWLACRITSQAAGGSGDPAAAGRGTEEVVGADADGQASGAPQGRPNQATGVSRDPGAAALGRASGERPSTEALAGSDPALGGALSTEDWLRRLRGGSQARPLAQRIDWHLDPEVFGGILPERLLAALPTADGLYCGLVLQMSTTGKPTLDFWERIDDLERQGFVPISAAKARAICDALPRFLDRLEQLDTNTDTDTVNLERPKGQGPP